MNILTKKLKTMVLTRRLAEVEGNIKFWSGLVDRWEQQLKALEQKKLSSAFSSVIASKLDGDINFNRTRIVNWRRESDSIRNQLRELGVEARANL